MSNAKNNKKKKLSKKKKNRTSLKNHKRKGKTLLPPFAEKGGLNFQLTSWMNERLPEMVWVALIITYFDRNYALGQLRRILNFISRHERRSEFFDITLSGISRLDLELRRELIRYILEPSETANALVSLRLFQTLPSKEVWVEFLPMGEPDLELLMNAVGLTLWHQSDEATDCRWMRLMGQIISGRLQVYPEMADKLLKYPNEYDQREVRPIIRATELTQDPDSVPDLTWSNNFWKEAWGNTPCIELNNNVEHSQIEVAVTHQDISNLEDALKNHWRSTHTTTAIDPKHDAIMGMAFYCLKILNELLGITVGTSILGRLGLRTILETRINLRYLLEKDDLELWSKWRRYGAGQAKLNALKFDELVEAPSHISVQSIENICSEDIWEEFITIDLAGWSGIDLRRMSERANLKDIYDKHYSWSSGYAHGMWGPVRESCYKTCGNPLHRLHRYPDSNILNDVVEDAVDLVNDVLCDLNEAYPTFTFRLGNSLSDTN